MPDWPAPGGKISYNEIFNFYSAETGEKNDMGEPPLPLGFVPDPEAFSAPLNSSVYVNTDFTLKERGTIEHRLPAAYAQFLPLLEQIAAYEAEHNPYFLHSSCVMTIRQTGVRKGRMQVDQDWHTDAAHPSPHVFTHSHIYVASDKAPTLCQKVAVPFAQAALSNATLAKNPDLVYEPQPYEVDLLSDYTNHRPQKAKEGCIRTFLRVTYYGIDRAVIDQHGMPPGLGNALQEQGLKP